MSDGTVTKRMNVEGGAPRQDVDARRARRRRRRRAQLANTAKMPFVFKHRRGDARRARRHRRDRRLGDPDEGRDHSGGGRRRHRLRHDGGADDADGDRSAGHPRARCARRSSARCRTAARSRARATRARGAIRRRIGVDARGRVSRSGFERIVAEASAPEDRTTARAPRHARHRQPLHRGLPRRAEQTVWLMLHSGSRGVGNAIGQHFIELAQQDMRKHFINLPDRDLAYFAEGHGALRRLRRGGATGRRTSRRTNRRRDDGTSVLRVLREESRSRSSSASRR